MKLVLSSTLMAGAGMVLGAVGMHAVNAATARAPAFLIANVTDIRDAAMWKKYQAEVPATSIAFEGKTLARGNAVEVDATSSPPDGTIVVVQFPDLKHLLGWYNSPAYAKVKPLRLNSVTTHLYAVEGVPSS